MLRRVLLIVVSSIIVGCQTSPHVDDPFEGLNRATFHFNKTVDRALIKPVAYVYLKYLPKPFQFVIGNFFDNLREIQNVANDLLQVQFALAAHDASRFLINSTIGIGGIFDPASTLGLEHRKEDFGQTLYAWGYHHSYYLVLPFLGPSTFRDAIGIGVDYYVLSVWPWIGSDWRAILLGADYIDIRARLLRTESVLDVIAVDEYVFMRNAYFQHRDYLFKKAFAAENADDIDNGVILPAEEPGTSAESEASKKEHSKKEQPLEKSLKKGSLDKESLKKEPLKEEPKKGSLEIAKEPLKEESKKKGSLKEEPLKEQSLKKEPLDKEKGNKALQKKPGEA